MADAKVSAASKGLGVDAMMAQATANTSETKKSFGVSEQFQKYMHQSFSSKKTDVASNLAANKNDNKIKISNQKKLVIKEAKVCSLDDKLNRASTKDILNQVSDIIRDIVEEQFEIADDEMEEALSNLGFGVLNLLDVKNLADFVSEISNSGDITNLLLGEDFRNLLLTMQDISKQIQDIMGITSDEVGLIPEKIVSEYTLANYVDNNTDVNHEDNQKILKQGEDVGGKAVSTLSSEINTSENGDNKSKVVDDKNLNIEVVKEESKAESDENKDNSNLEKNLNKDSTIEAGQVKDNTEKENKNSFEKTKNNILNKSNEDGTLSAHINTNKVDVSTPQVNVTQYMQGDRTLVLIERIANNLKIVMQEHATTMEMQLEPENLGKLFLQVTAKNGEIHAQISAQNEAIKSIISNQLVALEENLKNAGLKVEAIDVTVASHNFEQNLEQNSKRDEENANILQGNLKTIRRNINLDSLEDLTGLMSEEEMLVAQIMKDNGNSVDMTA
ncbi:MAG: flagellar hook-length control protein FliK [Lachnobacterium sp.]|nr:flagellar hook-length control protein FliK [Lachnobacterium sp.]